MNQSEIIDGASDLISCVKVEHQIKPAVQYLYRKTSLSKILNQRLLALMSLEK